MAFRRLEWKHRQLQELVQMVTTVTEGFHPPPVPGKIKLVLTSTMASHLGRQFKHETFRNCQALPWFFCTHLFLVTHFCLLSVHILTVAHFLLASHLFPGITSLLNGTKQYHLGPCCLTSYSLVHSYSVDSRVSCCLFAFVERLPAGGRT